MYNDVCGHHHLKFPPGFKFGAVTSAYQIEGGWNAGDKAPSIWDVYTHKYPFRIANFSNADIACDSFHLWREDVRIAANLGLHYYRISISWTRLLPKGFSNYVSRTGTKYYNRIIDGLLEKGIEPVITLYHSDLPQNLQDLGGWANPLVADWFANYARIAFSIFGDRVKKWITINEPIVICELEYTTPINAPSISSPGLGNYLCTKNILLAHAKAWRVYDEEFRSLYDGKISITNQMYWLQAETEEFEELAELARQLYVGLYLHPIFSSKGGWPSSVENWIAEKSEREGYRDSRLPAFTDEEKELVKGISPWDS
ncbi:myrosinase 1-like [Leptidea sinapis]|uniref:myrosinase 1-like n=1 Tax=Leptidea sinapis TaxID=189913 RepID=UPI0021C35691|nr:myrosinase 1-like [Leptidea sinapis]